MLEVLARILFYFLASYGALLLIVTVINSIKDRARDENPKIKMVLIIKNQEETIEGILRGIFAGSMLRKMRACERLTVVDMGSSDKTMDILLKLKDDDEPFDLLIEKDKEEIFKGFEEQINDKK